MSYDCHMIIQVYLEVAPGNPDPSQPCREEDVKEEGEADQEPAEEETLIREHANCNVRRTLIGSLG